MFVANIWLIRAYNPRVLLLQTSLLGIFTINFFGDVSDCEIFRSLRRHSEVLVVKIPGFVSLYFLRYILWKLGFWTSLEISLK
jgi:hypothetical protein